MIAAYKKEKYTSAGVNKYKWRCVAGSPLHPVRPSHKALNGKIFSFDDPPITTMPGEPVRRNNPREDYGCRCHAVPIVEF
jgi:SPP1 gp7 family putative phage head morphogenesis protein